MIDMMIEKIVSWQDIQLNGQNNCLGTRKPQPKLLRIDL